MRRVIGSRLFDEQHATFSPSRECCVKVPASAILPCILPEGAGDESCSSSDSFLFIDVGAVFEELKPVTCDVWSPVS